MQKICVNCGTNFAITDDDLAFLDRVSPVFNNVKYKIPPPSHCPDCRQQRRLAQCNEQFLYPGTCGLCGKRTVTENPPHAAQTIYCRECWYSDKWDTRDYGKEFDFSRPFFEQFYELRRTVPAIALNQTGIIENSDYIHYAGSSKNCYLIAHADFCEDCCYGYGFKKNTSCMDGFYNLHCELCYDGVYIHKSYGLIGCQDCVSCSNSAFLKDCIGCKNCFLCTGLRDCEYFFENKKLSRAEYEAKMKEIDLGSFEQYQEYKVRLREMEKRMVVKEYTGHNIENSSGNYLQNCKNCEACFDVEDGEDLKYCYQLVLGAKDCRDIFQFGTKVAESYECSIVGGNAYHNLFTHITDINNTNIFYCCFLVNSCKNCFGCCNMSGKSYCILNKQYTKDEYERLVPKIIEHMGGTPASAQRERAGQVKEPEPSGDWRRSEAELKNKEWGEFLPISTSLFGYNKTDAQLYYPLTREQALAQGFKWDDYEPPMPAAPKIIPAHKLPDNIKEIPDEIVDWPILCAETGRPFKIQPLELKLLRQMKVPLPRLHPDIRHRNRFALRNPRKLWPRNCENCKREIMTTYNPERSEKIYCEECYLKTVY